MQREPHAQPDGRGDVVIYEHILYQYRIDGDADDDEKALKRQSQQGAKIILPHAAPFLAHHGGHRDGGHGRDKVNLNHTAIEDVYKRQAVDRAEDQLPLAPGIAGVDHLGHIFPPQQGTQDVYKRQAGASAAGPSMGLAASAGSSTVAADSTTGSGWSLSLIHI